MRTGFAMILAAAVLIAPLKGALAQQDIASCPSATAVPPAGFEGWSARRPLAAASQPSGLRGAALEPGSAVDAALHSTSGVRYITRPEKPGGSVSYGGLFQFTVRQTGTYRVMLGSAAWIDVLKGKSALASTAHGHGPECSGIRKMVDFPLTPGRYTLQIAANGEQTLPLMIARLP